MPRPPEPPIAFWARAREIEKGLPDQEALLVVSEANWLTGTHAGQYSEVGRFHAAQLLAKNTHRLATEEEAEEYYAAIATRRAALVEAAEKRNKPTPYVVYLRDGEAPVQAAQLATQPPPQADKPAKESKAKAKDKPDKAEE